MSELPMMKTIQTELDAHHAACRRDAADPAASVWVSANAGTGKTHVLTMRVLRLMLAGTPPERILCLTYTKAARPRCRSASSTTLAKWVMLPDDDLEATLGNDKFLDREPIGGRDGARAHALHARRPRRRAASRCRPSTPSPSGCCSASRSKPA